MALCLKTLKQTSIQSFLASSPSIQSQEEKLCPQNSRQDQDEAAVVRECCFATLNCCSHTDKLEFFPRERSNCQHDFCDKDLGANPWHMSTATETITSVITYQRRKNRKGNLLGDAFEMKNQPQIVKLSNTALPERATKKPSISRGIDSCKKYSSSFIGHQSQSHRRRVCGQYFLDLGQADFSYSTCRTCGLFYARGHEEDDKLHATFHKTYLQGIQFKGWLHERLVMQYNKNDDRIILVLPTDPPHHQHKVKEVARFMETQLGLISGWLIHGNCKVYFFISLKKVVGCAVAESIKEAFPVFPEREQAGNEVVTNSISGVTDVQIDKMRIFGSDGSKLSCGEVGCSTQQEGYYPRSNQDGSTQGLTKHTVLAFGNIKFEQEVQKRSKSHSPTTVGQAMSCSKAPVCAVCGVRGIWVSQAERRRGIATKLLDTVRATFFYGFTVDLSQCAFSQPTSDGKAFAAKYFKTQRFLVYS